MKAALFVASVATACAIGAGTARAQQAPGGAWAHLGIGGALSFTCDRDCALADAQNTSMRLAVPVLDHVAPWVSYARFNELASCVDSCGATDGTEVMAGLLFDFAGERSPRALHPFAVVGAGRLTSARLYGSRVATHAGAGVYWRLLPVIAPGLELAWERYPIHGTMAMVAIGARASVPRW